jgi:hypothetical protein
MNSKSAECSKTVKIPHLDNAIITRSAEGRFRTLYDFPSVQFPDEFIGSKLPTEFDKVSVTCPRILYQSL